jgi:hypothetical protein
MRSLHPEEIADLHLITGDLPAGDMRIGQMPTWLDPQNTCSTHLRVHHHWEIFKMRMRGVVEPEAAAWRNNILPTFNSIGIETQLVTLAPELTDTILYVCYIVFFPDGRALILMFIFRSSMTTFSSLEI